MLVEKDPVIVPVLRAGLGMTDGLLTLLPAARVGHIGVYRNAQHEPVEYLVRLPDAPDSNYIVVDPMIAHRPFCSLRHRNSQAQRHQGKSDPLHGPRCRS